MPLFSKESLENLRQRIELIEVLSSHLDLKRLGASYKALCPFHDEKTPSFVVQKGDRHYHCFGCGAHGDAIQFLMTHLKMSFLEAVEYLAQRFQVRLEVVEGGHEKKGISHTLLKEVLEQACRFYHFMLLQTPEGHEALHYLANRGISLDFVRQFRLGLSPRDRTAFRKVMGAKGYKDDVLIEAGLLSQLSNGDKKDFFSDRVMIPIHHPSGAVIGFSGRKYREATFGGKYVNTPETSLFKKSQLLFGLNYSRRRIAKERRAIIVEGQIDALRLIQEGCNIAVAGQGTAFGSGHVSQLVGLGVNKVFLALDADEAGREAAVKIGDLFQKDGVAVGILEIPLGSDPDLFVREKGIASFLQLMDKSLDYLTFLFRYYSRRIDMSSPAGKSEVLQTLAHQIRRWGNRVMIHESLRKLAHLAQVPEDMLGVGQDYLPSLYVKKSASAGLHRVDPDAILESDLLRWLVLMGEECPHFVDIAKTNVSVEDFRVALCCRLYQKYLEAYDHKQPLDLLSLAGNLEEAEDTLFMSDLLKKKVNKERAEQHFLETVQKVLERNWMHQREEVKMKIQSGQCSDEEVLALAKQFDELKRNKPQVKKNEASCVL